MQLPDKKALTMVVKCPCAQLSKGSTVWGTRIMAVFTIPLQGGHSMTVRL